MSERRRVVITGVGVVSPVGLDAETTFEALLAGRSGLGPITLFDASNHTTRIAGEVKDFDPTSFLVPKHARKLDRFTSMGLRAGLSAWEDSGLDITTLDATRVGSIAGSGIGGLESIESQHQVMLERGPGRVTPFLIPKLMMNALSGELSMLLGIKGQNWVTASACASSSHALGSALRAIQYGEADIMVSGGSEAAITPLGMAGFCSLRAMSQRNDDPEQASRPFDKDRDGFIMGEGAAFLVLEELESARKRGARIYAEFCGFGATADAHHITAPAPNAEGAQRSMRQCLADAGLNAGDVDYVNAHGTSTPINDPNESAAIRAVFGSDADRLAISSTKSMIGHLLGGSGAAESAICALSISRGVLHMTRNHVEPGEGCDLDYVKEGARETRIRAALSNSLGFGGHNVTLAFRQLT
ncbi:MAG: beta-ketoacyl-[acyl-carrier-protein] synthase II [Planctomycetes bacterium]|nr:beta-ketoacyl-[acyl-carrier-protein] synthase II [Planctomycetota bacterium]